MAGIQGQPAPKPNNVEQPVPGATSQSVFDQAQPGMAQAAGKAASVFDQAPAAPPDQSQGYQGPGSGALQTAADWAPTALGIGGSVVGAAAGPAGMVGGAALGGVSGQGIKQFIEANILGKPPTDPNQALFDDAKEGLKQGLGATIGLGIGKAVTSLAATKAGAAVIDTVADLAAKPLAMMKSYVQSAYDEATAPLLKLISGKVTPLNTEQAGDNIKGLFAQDLQARFGKFVNSYGDLDAVAKATPMFDATRPNFFTPQLKEWAKSEYGGDNARMINKFADDFADVTNGKQFSDIIQQINGKANEAGSNLLRNQAEALRALRDKAENFMETRTMQMAGRIQNGKASGDELGMLQQLMENRGIAEDNPEKYAKSLAKDYLGQRDTVKAAYSQFRGFLSDVGEQVKINADTRGPLQFLKDLQDVPSEKLVERMFDPKNAAALRAMQAETPQVFDQVAKSKMSQLMQNSSPDGNLDLMALRTAINKMPGATRDMLMNSSERGVMDSVLNNPKLEALDNLNKTGLAKMTSWAAQAAEVARIGTKSAGSAIGRGIATAPVRQGLGNTLASPLANAFMPQPPQGGGQ